MLRVVFLRCVCNDENANRLRNRVKQGDASEMGNWLDGNEFQSASSSFHPTLTAAFRAATFDPPIESFISRFKTHSKDVQDFK